jgi:ParB-like chromosome segregation protein Spo0J
MINEEFHPAANLFPLMREEAMVTLAADIAAHGLREPIMRHKDGRIIDGRNRWLACQRVGVTCHAHTWPGEDKDLVSYVVSLNLERRHLTDGQRAAVAAEIANFGWGRSEMSKTPSGVLPPGERPAPVRIDDAAALMRVSRRSVERARAVKSADTEIFEKVKSGEMKIYSAMKAVGKDEQGKGGKLTASKLGKAGGKNNKKKPRVPVLVHDADEEAAVSMLYLIRQVSELADKIEPELAYLKLPAKLLHNLDINLRPATDFLVRLHACWLAGKQDAAGMGPAA